MSRAAAASGQRRSDGKRARRTRGYQFNRLPGSTMRTRSEIPCRAIYRLSINPRCLQQLIFGVSAPFSLKPAFLTQSSTCPPRLAGGERGRAGLLRDEGQTGKQGIAGCVSHGSTTRVLLPLLNFFPLGRITLPKIGHPPRHGWGSLNDTSTAAWRSLGRSWVSWWAAAAMVLSGVGRNGVDADFWSASSFSEGWCARWERNPRDRQFQLSDGS